MPLTSKHFEILFTSCEEMAKYINVKDISTQMKEYLSESDISDCLDEASNSDNLSQMRVLLAKIISTNNENVYNLLSNYIIDKIRGPLLLYQKMTFQNKSENANDTVYPDVKSDQPTINSNADNDLSSRCLILQSQLQAANSTIRELHVALSAMHDMVTQFNHVQIEMKTHTSQQQSLHDLLQKVQKKVQKTSDAVNNLTTTTGTTSFPSFTSISSHSLSSSSSSFHRGVHCDECRTQGVMGNRFKCVECPDYDLCQECFLKGCHVNHDFYVNRKPKSKNDFSHIFSQMLKNVGTYPTLQ